MTSDTILPSHISREQALEIARADAATAYRDLSVYTVKVALKDNSWHIDYELADPEAQGGGPHYVIDSINGKLLSKRYEQ